MNSKENDKRYLKSKLAIEQALGKLYDEGKTESEITVSEITNAAGIARKTFYLHYTDLNDFYTKFIAENVVKVSNDVLFNYELDFKTDLSNFFIKLTNFIIDSKLVRMLLKTKEYSTILFNELKKEVKIFINNHSGAPDITLYGKEFFASGIVSTYAYWLGNTYLSYLKPTYEEDIRSFISKASDFLGSFTP